MTTLTFHLGRALARQWAAGRRDRRHRARPPRQLRPVAALARERGLTIRAVRFRPAHRPARPGRPRPRDRPADAPPRDRRGLERARHRQRRRRTPRALAHAAGALVFVDAVHYAAARARGRGRASVRLPRLLGLQVLRPARRASSGDARTSSRRSTRPKLEPAPENAPDRLETGHAEPRGDRRGRRRGRLPRVARAGRGAAAPGSCARSPRSTSAGRALVERLWSGLRAIDGVTLYGPPPTAPRTPTVSFTVAGPQLRRGRAASLADRAVFVSNGDFYATTVVAPARPRRRRPRARRVRLLHDRRRGRPARGRRRRPGARVSGRPLRAARLRRAVGVRRRSPSPASAVARAGRRGAGGDAPPARRPDRPTSPRSTTRPATRTRSRPR